jgi:hypothetical protein
MAEIIILPTSLPRDGSWLEELEERLLERGMLADVKEQTGWPGRIDRILVYDIIHWRCWRHGHNICPAVVFADDGNVYLLRLSENEERFVKVLDFKQVMIEEIRGLIRYSECLAKHGYDYPC